MIKLSNISLMRGNKTLFEQADLTFHVGHKIGLTGNNGSGKSSFFAMLMGSLHADTGDLYIPKDWTIAWMAQEIEDLACQVLDFVLQGDEQYYQLKSELDAPQTTEHRIAEIHQQLDTIGGYAAESKAASLLFGLGFTNDQLTHQVSQFSGGWRVRLNLARALMCRSDLLLLDEPTNHLDLDTLIWLERWLKSYTGTLVLISHDRDFLDSVVNNIVHIEQQRVSAYSGNYSNFEKVRAEQLALQQSLYDKQQKQRAHLQKFIDRFKAKASKAKQAQSRVKMLEKMQTIQAAQADSQFHFQFFAPAKLPNPLIYMENVNAGYGDKRVLEQIKLNLVPGSRIGLLGRNGAGKSTLIKLLAKEITPQSGSFESRQGLEIGYFAQHQLEYLVATESPLQHLQRLYRDKTEQQLRDYLGGFGFSGDQASQSVAQFSGGEKARLVLAMLVMQKPNLLLLDEPTNHLDLQMRQALNFALQDFEGAMLIVSHDRHLLRSVCDEFYLVDQQQVSPYRGTIEDYESWMLTAATNKPSSLTNNNAQQKKLDKRQAAELRQKLSPIKKNITQLEKQLDKLNSELEAVEMTLAAPETYEQQNKETLQQALAEQRNIKSQLEDIEMDWLDHQEQLEQLQAENE